MGLKDLFKGVFGTREPSEERRPFREAAGTTVDPDEDQWRRLTGNSNRDLQPLTQRRMQELGVYLWKTNPLANRLIELPVAYLLAEGVRLSVQDEEAQAWLDSFWADPINAMDLKLPKKVRELALYGEQCWPVFVNEFDGQVRLGYLDPGVIETVVTDPDNIEQPIGIVTVKDSRGQARRYRVIVNGPETVFSQRTQAIRETFDTGECFFFAVNDLSNATRGHSDMLSQMDWLDGYDHAMFGELERWDFLRAFIYDVTLTGATEDEVKARAREITTPKPGSVRVHNDSEAWTALAPALQSADSEALARLFRNHVMGGATIPEHWYGGGGDVNRATAGEMGEPTFKVFSMRQRTWKHILEAVGTYVVRQRLAKNYGADQYGANRPEDYAVEAVFPELTTRDVTSYASSLQQVVTACGLAIDRGLLSEKTALLIIALVAARLGMEIDVEAELQAAKTEAGRRAEADTFPPIPDDPEDGDPQDEDPDDLSGTERAA